MVDQSDADLPGSDPVAPEAALDVIPPAPSFADLGHPPALQLAVQRLGWDLPTPVQVAAYRPMLEGRDLLVQSHTGSGKTGAFCLPW